MKRQDVGWRGGNKGEEVAGATLLLFWPVSVSVLVLLCFVDRWTALNAVDST